MNTTSHTARTVARSGRATRVAARTAAAVVAIVAGAASFEHIASVAIAAGERTWVGYSLPFAIDGLIVVGVAALVEDQHRHRQPRASARLAVLVGVVATLAANVASAEPTATARLVALAAPVSFLLSVEVLTRTGRKLSTPDDSSNLDPHRSTSDERPATATPPTTPDAAPRRSTRRRATAAQRVITAVQKTPDATAAQIAARLKVSERTVQRYWPAPAPATPAPAGNGHRADPARTGGVAPVTGLVARPARAGQSRSRARPPGAEASRPVPTVSDE